MFLEEIKMGKKRISLDFNEQAKIVERMLRDAIRFEKIDKLDEVLKLLQRPKIKTVMEKSDVKGIKSFIDEEFNTYLHLAAAMGSDEVIKKLIEAGADVNAKNENGETPLHNAARYNRASCIKVLLGGETIKPNEKNRNGHTPLHIINYLRDFKEDGIKELLKSPKINIEELSGENSTALFEAVLFKNKPIVKLLLEAGADANTEQSDLTETKSVLKAAVEGGEIDLVEMLLNKNADPYKFGYRCISPVAYAVADDNQECIKLFLDKGVDLTLADKMFKKSPLQMAEGSSRDQVAKLIRNDIAFKAAKKIKAYSIH